MKIFTKIKKNYKEKLQAKYQDYVKKLVDKKKYNARDLSIENFVAMRAIGIETIAIGILLILTTILVIALIRIS